MLCVVVSMGSGVWRWKGVSKTIARWSKLRGIRREANRRQCSSVMKDEGKRVQGPSKWYLGDDGVRGGVETAWLADGVARSARVAVSAHVHPIARVGDEVTIMDQSIVDRGVDLGTGCVVGESVRLMRDCLVGDFTEIGPRCRIYPRAVLGFPPQDRKYRDGPTKLLIASDCIIREDVKIERGTEIAGGITRLGQRVLIMAGSYVGHDSSIGDDVVVANSTSIAGHAVLGSNCVIGGHCVIHQRVRVGQGAMVGGLSAIRRDVVPHTVVTGNPPSMRALNYRKLWPLLAPADRKLAVALYKYLFYARNKPMYKWEAFSHLAQETAQHSCLRDRASQVLNAVSNGKNSSDMPRNPDYPKKGATLVIDRVVDRVFENIATFILEPSVRGLHLPIPSKSVLETSSST